MDLNEKTILAEEIYKGHFITVEKVYVELPNKNKSSRDIVRHPGGVAVIAETSDNKILFVEQFRKPIDSVLLEIPAGKIEKGEDPKECAIRELEEETGYKAHSFTFLGKIAMTPGFCDEMMYFYYAKDLYDGVKGGDEDEFINLKSYTLDEIDEMIKTGVIIDSKTISGMKLMETLKK